MSSYKLIRDLRDFAVDEVVKTSDYFIAASNPDGTAVEETFKMTIKDLVGQYNQEKTAEQSDPTNPMFGETATTVEMVNGVEVIVDATPITSANLDTLVDPGSGLEVITTCLDVTRVVVPCESPPGTPNPAVKYKKKKLSFAKSAASKSLTLNCNSTGLDWLTNKASFIVNSAGVIDQRFINLKSAYDYLNNEIVSSDITINIFIETDLDEGVQYSNGYRLSLPFNKVNIYGAEFNSTTLRKIKLHWGVGYTLGSDAATRAEWNHVVQAKHGVYQGSTGSVMATLPAGVTLHQHASVPFWINCNTYWRGIHFVIESYCIGIFAFYRQTRGTDGYLAQCKFSLKNYNTHDGTKHGCAYVFDVRDQSRLHIQNTNDGSPGDDLKDPAGTGNVISGLELDFKEFTFIDSIFGAEDGAKILLIEYGSNYYNPASTIASRLCFTSNVPDANNFCTLRRGSAFQQNALITRTSGVTLNVDFAMNGEGFNTVSSSLTMGDQNAVQRTNSWPGATLYTATTILNTDIRNQGNVPNGNPYELDGYYANQTVWSAP